MSRSPDPEPFDPYRELQLAPGAEPELVKAAFKALAKKHHPDRFTDPQEKLRAEERMKRINEAQRMLAEGGYRPPAAEPPSSEKHETSPTPERPRADGSFDRPRTSNRGRPLHFGLFALLFLALIASMAAGPWLSRYHQSKAAALLTEARLSEALQEADLALKRDSRNGEAYLLRAEIYDRLGETEKANIDRRNGEGLLPNRENSTVPDQDPTPSPKPPAGSGR